MVACKDVVIGFKVVMVVVVVGLVVDGGVVVISCVTVTTGPHVVGHWHGWHHHQMVHGLQTQPQGFSDDTGTVNVVVIGL